MANASYTSFKNAMLGGDVDLLAATVKVALVRGYTFNAAHQVVADITGAGGIIHATSNALANKTITAGVFDADDVTITTAADAAAHILIAYQASAVTGGADVPAAQQVLCWYFDTGTGIPVTPGTGVITVTWPSTAAKIYKIG
jgi:hypothetical protein